jgi:hypothetical protein
MSEDGRESLLRLRALTQRFAASVPAFAEPGGANAAVERLATSGSLPLVDFDPLGEMGRIAEAGASALAELPGRIVASPPSPLPGRKEASAAPRTSRLDRGPLIEAPSPSAVEPVGLGLVASLLSRIEAGESSASAPQGTAAATRKPLTSPLPIRHRERPAAPRAAETARGQAAPAGPSEAATSAARLDRSRFSPAPILAPAEPVGLGLVASLLARIGPDGAPANAPLGVSPATRTSFEPSLPTRNRERPTPPRIAEPPRGQDASSGTGASNPGPFEECPIAPIFPSSGYPERSKPPAENAPFGGLVAEPASDSLAPDLGSSPLVSARPTSPSLDPDLLADLVNDALVAQAVRFGIDLS